MNLLPRTLRVRLAIALGALVFLAGLAATWSLGPRTGIAIALAATVIAALAGWWLGGRFVRPLETLTATARRIESGELGLEIARVESPLEVAQLSAALRDMKESLLDRQAALALANHRLEDRVAERNAELTAARRQLAEANESLRELAHADGLTGLANRRAAEDRLAIEMSRHRRSRQCLSLLLLDVDHLDRVNDAHGPVAGDTVLKAIALALQDACRAADGVARVGDDEFVVTMPETTRSGAHIVAEKVRTAVAALDEVPAAVTVSIGLVSQVEAYVDAEAAMREAGAALDAARESGGNRIVAREDLESLATGASSRSSRTSR